MSEKQPPPVRIEVIRDQLSTSGIDRVLNAAILAQLPSLASDHMVRSSNEPGYPSSPEYAANDRATSAYNAIQVCRAPFDRDQGMQQILLVEGKNSRSVKRGDDCLNSPLYISLNEGDNTMSWNKEPTPGSWKIIRIFSPNADGRVNCEIDNGSGKYGSTRIIDLDPDEVQAALIRSVSTNNLTEDPVYSRMSAGQKALYEARSLSDAGTPDALVTLPDGSKRKAAELLSDSSVSKEAARDTGIITGEAVHAKIDNYLKAEYARLGIKNLPPPVEPLKTPEPIVPVDPKIDATKYNALTPQDKTVADNAYTAALTKYQADKNAYYSAKPAYDTAFANYQTDKVAYDADQKTIAGSKESISVLQQIDSLKNSIDKDGVPTGEQLGALTHLIRLPEIQANLAELKSKKDSILANIQLLPPGPQREKLQGELNKLIENETIQRELIESDKKRMQEHFGRLQNGIISQADPAGKALSEMFTPGGDIAKLTKDLDNMDAIAIEKRLNPEDKSYWGFFTKFLKENQAHVKIIGGLAFYLLNMLYTSSMRAHTMHR